MGYIWNYYGCITVFFCKAVLWIVPTTSAIACSENKSYTFHLWKNIPEFTFSYIVLYVCIYIYIYHIYMCAYTSKPACHWPLVSL